MDATKPKVSLIFPVYGQCELLLRALTTLREVTHYPNYEVILVDDCSEENMDDVYGRESLYDRLVRLPRNTGNSTVVVNEGVKLSSGDFIQYQNTDVYFEDPLWLDKIIDSFDEHTAVVGPALLFPNTTVQSAGCFFDRRALNHELYNFRLYETIDKRTIEVPMVAGCGLTTPRDVYEKLQGFRVFEPYGWDDTDWCLRARQSGYKTKLCLDSSFYHLHNVSYYGRDNPRYHENQKKIFKEFKDIIKEVSRFRLEKKKCVVFLKDLTASTTNLALVESIRKHDVGRKSQLLVFAHETGELENELLQFGARVFPPWYSHALKKIPILSGGAVGLAKNAYRCFSFLRAERPDVVVYDSSFFRRYLLTHLIGTVLPGSPTFMRLASFGDHVQKISD